MKKAFGREPIRTKSEKVGNVSREAHAAMRAEKARIISDIEVPRLSKMKYTVQHWEEKQKEIAEEVTKDEGKIEVVSEVVEPDEEKQSLEEGQPLKEMANDSLEKFISKKDVKAGIKGDLETWQPVVINLNGQKVDKDKKEPPIKVNTASIWRVARAAMAQEWRRALGRPQKSRTESYYEREAREWEKKKIEEKERVVREKEEVMRKRQAKIEAKRLEKERKEAEEKMRKMEKAHNWASGGKGDLGMETSNWDKKIANAKDGKLL